MRRPVVTIGSAILSVILSGTFIMSGCSGRSGKSGDIPMAVDEAGIILGGTMPDTLPEGFSWFVFKEDTSLFDLMDDMFVNYHITDMAVRSDRTWVLVSEYTVDTSTDHLISVGEDGQILTDQVIVSEDFYARELAVGDDLYLKAFDFESSDDILIPVDETAGIPDEDSMISISGFVSPGDYLNDYVFMEDKIVILTNGQEYKVTVADPSSGETEQTIDLEDIMRPYGIEWLEGIDVAGTDKIVVWGATSVNQYFDHTRYLILDLATGQMSALDEKEFISIPLRNLFSSNGKLISATDAGLYRIDLENNTCELILSFNLSNCNRYLVNNSDLVYSDDDKMVFSYSSRFAGIGQLSNAFCVFTRSGSYPAAGKQILTVASTDDLDYTVSEAMMRFNDSSDTSFLLFDGRYKANTAIDYSNTGDADAASLDSLNSYATVSDRLALDIISGNGPDIIITSGANEQLSRSDYFLDLSDYLVESGITDAEYFMNAIDASRYGGALYQLPIGFYVDGFLSSEENFGGQTGMTFEEYGRMVDTVCNGADPMYDHQLYYSRTDVATKLFADMNELFINDGHIDVGNDSFRAILDYCRDLPSEPAATETDLSDGYEDFIYAMEQLPVQKLRIDGFSEFERLYDRFGEVSLCGYPSVDGRSAVVGSDRAVSISAGSSDPQACKDFLSILLSGDIQHSLQQCIPVNRTAARSLFMEEIEDHNAWVEEGYNDMFGVRPYDESLADNYILQISQASTSCFIDHSIALIIYEEVPAYFEGQKTFEEVVETINDRAQTVLDERR